MHTTKIQKVFPLKKYNQSLDNAQSDKDNNYMRAKGDRTTKNFKPTVNKITAAIRAAIGTSKIFLTHTSYLSQKAFQLRIKSISAQSFSNRQPKTAIMTSILSDIGLS